MACPIPAERLKELEMFIGLIKQNPVILQFPELKFFREYLQSLGASIPEQSTPGPQPSKPAPKPAETAAPASPMESSSSESEVELDMSGVIEDDSDESEPMGVDGGEVSEEKIDESNEKKRSAVEFFSSGDFEKATKAYTDAILLNPNSAILYAKRGQTFLKRNKPKACVRDCNKAIALNPDCAAAYKFRGRAHRLLGQFIPAAEDLRCACKLDFDEQADEWLKEVTPNARKIEEHTRNVERKRVERQRARAARARGQKPQPSQPKPPQPNPSFLQNLFSDPEIVQSLSDPDIAAAFEDVSKNPTNIFKYKSNPKVAKFLAKIMATLGVDPSAGEAFADAQIPTPTPPTAPADVDLD